MGRLRCQHGFILIMAMWTLAFLAVLAVSIGFGTRQKVILLGRLEDRSRAQLAAEAGVKKAVAVLLDDLEENQFMYSASAKARRHNNPADFAGMTIGDIPVEVVCTSVDETAAKTTKFYGMCDEQGKININTTDRDTLTRLFVHGASLPEDTALKLAEAVLDWRDYGKHEAEGFFSDDYYKNLEHPYAMKEKPFERIDELFLVRGITREIYAAMRPYVTVWGDGHVNVNTAPRQVLLAMGLDVGVADKLLQVRRGPDGQEFTADDHIFLRTFDIAAEVNSIVKLETWQTHQLDTLNAQGRLGVDSTLYAIHARVLSEGAESRRTIEAVFNVLSNKFEYWYEK
ncbi:MAG: general secretion pathway protein GspK [Candidatus Omnitrophica bacterium]|nr:general secretion pathway protein GspK [Candidatus Omnitrophota bacterium]